MNLANLAIDIGIFSAAGFAACLAALGTWFIVRRQMRRVTLPILRVLSFDDQRLPKFRALPPPWLAFACFAVAAAAFAFFLARPTELSFTPFDPKQNRNHIVLDMTPSVSAYVTPDAYAARVVPLFRALRKTGKVTVSTTHDLQVIEPDTEEALAEFVRAKGFHRYGVRLGGLMRALLDKIGDVDRLFVVSDAEEGTWGDFNWRFLQDQMEVVYVPVASGMTPGKANVAIADAAYVARQDSLNMEWEVELARTAVSQEGTGKLRARWRGKTLAEVPWSMPAGKDRVTVPVSWPAASVTGGAGAAGGDGAKDEPLEWELEPDGDDALAMDNVFRVDLRGRKRNALIIAEPSGEGSLEDHVHHLRVALEVLGMRVTRVDRAPAKAPEGNAYALVVAVGGFGTGVSNFCPAAFAKKRADGAPSPILWLASHDVEADYHELCQCYGGLVEGKPVTDSPLYCQEMSHRDHWVGILSSLGAKQLGGAVGDAAGAVAWASEAKGGRGPMLAFSVPLRPRVRTGLGYGQLPSLVRHLLMLQGVVGKGGKDEASPWRRVADASAAMGDGRDVKAMTALALGNVPTAESQLKLVDPAHLPTAWEGERMASGRGAAMRKDHDDPFPWIKLAAWVIIAVSLVEGGIVLLKGRRRPRVGPLVALIAVTGAVAWPKPARAGIDLTMVDPAKRPAQVAWLSREVAGRTSIDMNPTPRFFAAVDAAALREPWLWLKDAHAAADASGKLRPEVEAWLRRGGFLVIENARTPETLAKLTARLEGAGGADGGWQPIPPDHELLRSFHLLESLPVCQDAIWRGFPFDGRLAILAIPFSLTEALADTGANVPACVKSVEREYLARIFVNLAMVALATDYKKDQIHLPEILKRLR